MVRSQIYLYICAETFAGLWSGLVGNDAIRIRISRYTTWRALPFLSELKETHVGTPTVFYSTVCRRLLLDAAAE